MNQSKLRVGIIGAGAVVREIYQHLYFKSDYSEQLEICGVAARNEQRRNWFGDLAGLAANRRFASYQEMLASLELDAVQVNTPDDLHCEAAVAALQAGLDVIVPKPISVQGYDLVDSEVVFENGGTAHILTGWALPNSAWSTTVQSGRLICSEGLIDLGLDMPGLREIARDGVLEVNPLFRNFGKDGRVSGYGIDSPGRLYQQAWARRAETMSKAELDVALDPMTLGFYATLILEGANRG